MTEVFFTENVDHKITGFKSVGHAGFKKRGKDVVCAAISVLTINTENSLEKLAKADMDVTEDEKNGVISVHLKSEPDEKTEILFRSLLMGLKDTSAEYGDRYCKVTFKEELQ